MCRYFAVFILSVLIGNPSFAQDQSGSYTDAQQYYKILKKDVDHFDKIISNLDEWDKIDQQLGDLTEADMISWKKALKNLYDALENDFESLETIVKGHEDLVDSVYILKKRILDMEHHVRELAISHNVSIDD
ncbi:MAG TPA: hypothetical protein ACFCUD_08065 [Cyclobacteriaceae bacterium]